MRLIDADALEERMRNSSSYNDYEWAMYADEFFDEMKDAPTIEAVYICNRKRCDRCNPECDFTRDINYAAATDKVIVVDGAAYAVKGKPTGQWIQNPFEPDWDYCTACRQGTKRREHGTDDGHEWVREL